MDEIKNKLDKISDDIVEIKVTLAAQHADIAHHIKRSDLLEDKMDIMKQDIEADLEPIKKHVSQMDGIKDVVMFTLKVITVAAAVIAAIAKSKGMF